MLQNRQVSGKAPALSHITGCFLTPRTSGNWANLQMEMGCWGCLVLGCLVTWKMFGNVKTKINTIQKSWIKNNNKGKEPRSRKNLPLEPEFACLPGETQTFESPMQGSYEPHLNGGQHWVMCSKGYLFLSSNNIKPRILTSRPKPSCTRSSYISPELNVRNKQTLLL